MLAYTFYETDNRVIRYAETLVKRGDQVDVICLRKKGQKRKDVINGVCVFRIQQRVRNEQGKLSYLKKILFFFFNSACFLTWRHLRIKYDLIHVHSVPDFEVFAALIPKILGVKIILDIHDIVPEFYASKFMADSSSLLFNVLIWIEKLSSGFADHVIISNHIWGKTLVSRSVRSEKCAVILNYPDDSIFYRRNRTNHNERFIMMYPGTLNWHQGLDMAIRAFAKIKELDSHIDFHIYGDGPAKPFLEELIQDLGLQDRVLLKDPLPIREIAEKMSSAGIGIVPKRNDPFSGDAFSTKTLEFMYLGVPIIISETKIDKYYFNDSVVRFFIPENVDALASAMLEMIKKKERRKELSENALKFVEDFSWEKKKQEYLNLVDCLNNGC